MNDMVKLSEIQIEKGSSYLLDISKLIFGATVVPLFVPNAQFGAWQFAFGSLISGLSLILGLMVLKDKKI